MKVIAVLLLLAGLSRTAAFVTKPASSRATTDLSAMKKKTKAGPDKVCRILTTREPDVSMQSTSSYHTSTSSYHTLFSDASGQFG
jgi:hypothetical protein